MTAATVVYFPRQYLSEAKVFVRVGRETAALDPTATTGHVVTVQSAREREVNSVREILKSQSVLERAVDEIGVDTILNRKDRKTDVISKLMFPLKRLKQKIDDLDPITDRERAILAVKKQLRFSDAEAVDVITLSAKAASPHSAQTLASQYLNAFLDVHRSASRTEGGYQFFQDQTELLKCQLSRSSKALRDAKNRYGLLTLQGQRDVLNTRLASINDQIELTTAALAYSEAKAIDLKNSVDSLPETIVTASVSGIGHDATDNMRTQLYDLEIREKELAARYNASHPLLIAVREQRENVKEIFAQQQQQRTQTTTAVHTTREKLNMDWMFEKSSISALRSKNESLLTQLANLKEELVALNDNELRIAELERDVDLLSGKYRSYAERLEEARVDQALEDERISSINVVQPPTLSDKPVAPKKIVVVAIGLLLAVTAGVGVMMIADYFDTSFTTAEQVERQLALPVLASIPRKLRARKVEHLWRTA